MSADEEVFADFCRREHHRLVGALGLHCGDFDVAEELAQEALARVWRDWSAVQRKDSPEAWTYRIAMNLASSHFRRRRTERRLRERLASPPAATTPDVTDGLAIRDALQQIPARYRAVLVLRFYLDYSVTETAAALQLPPGTVTTFTRRGLERLGRQIGVTRETWEAARA